MKKRSTTRKIIFFLLLLWGTSPLQAQIQSSVTEIRDNPTRYIGQYMEVKGTVVQYVPHAPETAAHYLLRDDHGSYIKVIAIAQNPPKVNARYVVRGILSREGTDLVMHERTKKKLDLSTTELLFIVIGAVLILGIILFFSTQKKRKSPAVSQNISTPAGGMVQPKKRFHPVQPTGPPKPPVSDPLSQPISRPRPGTSDDDKTLKVESDYFTNKALPCSLTILSGEELGKQLPLFGKPTNEGVIITLGRDVTDWRNHVKPGFENAHIRIKDNTRTLSRMQAELTYKGGTMYLRNMGSANPTQVNGKSLGAGETAELKEGSVVQAGHLKLEYKPELLNV